MCFLHMHSDAAKFGRKLEENVFLTKVKPESDMSIEVSPTIDLVDCMCKCALITFWDWQM